MIPGVATSACASLLRGAAASGEGLSGERAMKSPIGSQFTLLTTFYFLFLLLFRGVTADRQQAVSLLYLGCSRSARPRGVTGHVAHPIRSIQSSAFSTFESRNCFR